MRSMLRYFGTAGLLLLALAVWDYGIRPDVAPGGAARSLAAAVVASSVPVAMVAGVVFLLGDCAWLVIVPILTWGVLCTTLESYFQLYFADCGQCGGVFATRFLTMSWEKTWAFFVSQGWEVWLTAFLLVFSFTWAVTWLVRFRVSAPNLKTIALGAAVLGGLSCFLPKVEEKDRFLAALGDHVFLGGYQQEASYRQIRAGAAVERGGYQTDETNLLAVVVIGESSSAAHWSLYGYARDTTPRLNGLRSELLVFRDVRAVHALTRSACLDAFSWTDGARPVSLASVAASAGYDCSLIGVLPPSGENEDTDELLFKACWPRTYLNPRDRVVCLDDAVIPAVATRLASVPTNQLIVVHTDGSHTSWEKHYPADRAKFPPDGTDPVVAGLDDRARRNVNHYDNTIAFTDGVLANLIETLRATGRRAVLAYVSDHGETPRTHARDDHERRELYGIPMVIWFSPAMRVEATEKFERLRQKSQGALTALDCPAVWRELLGLQEHQR